MAYLNKNKYAIAVSGGSDSLALLYLCAKNEISKKSIVVHFNHKLRNVADDEEKIVKQTAEKLGFKFISQHWDNIPTSGNMYQAARKARYQFFDKICKKNKLNGVLIAHSKTDLAETLLMRLGKGASLKGVSIFPQGVDVFGCKVYRPLLDFTREDLQNYLKEQNITWCVDKSNLDTKKMRPRIREILPKLEEIGISLTGFLKATNYFNQAMQAFDYYKEKELQNFTKSEYGYYKIDKSKFFNLPLEMQIILTNHIIEEYKTNDGHLPRRKNIIELLTRLKQTKIEPIDCIFIELIDKNLFFYVNDENYAGSLENILGTLDKKTRYKLVKQHKLEFLPIRIRNRVIIK